MGAEGWSSIQKHSMLPLKVSDETVVLSMIRGLMNRGLLRRHLQENSTLVEMKLSYVPYWIISVSARTNIVAADIATQVGTIAAAAVVLGAMSGMGGGHRRGGGGIVEGAVLGSVLSGGRIGGQATRKVHQLNENHNYPVVALRALADYQPHDLVRSDGSNRFRSVQSSERNSDLQWRCERGRRKKSGKDSCRATAVDEGTQEVPHDPANQYRNRFGRFRTSSRPSMGRKVRTQRKEDD
ncbi:MAG: hypothetical protein ACHQ03_11955, partial [Candidatus Bathyarchaeia archaeon]